MCSRSQHPEDAIENATAFTRGRPRGFQHRPDGGPFVVGEFVAHDLRHRFGSLNYVRGGTINPQKTIAADANTLISLPLSGAQPNGRTCYGSTPVVNDPLTDVLADGYIWVPAPSLHLDFYFFGGSTAFSLKGFWFAPKKNSPTISPISRSLIQDFPSMDDSVSPSISPADTRLCIDASSEAHSRFGAIGPIIANPTNLTVHRVRRSRLSRAPSGSPSMTLRSLAFSIARLPRSSASSGAITRDKYSRRTKCVSRSNQTKAGTNRVEPMRADPCIEALALTRSEMPISTCAGNGAPVCANAERASYTSLRNRRRLVFSIAGVP